MYFWFCPNQLTWLSSVPKIQIFLIKKSKIHPKPKVVGSSFAVNYKGALGLKHLPIFMFNPNLMSTPNTPKRSTWNNLFHLILFVLFVYIFLQVKKKDPPLPAYERVYMEQSFQARPF